MAYADGTSRMYGKTDDPDFRNVEGYEDHSVNLLFTYDRDSQLTGVVVNLACPSQVSESLFELSADFWHETRQELRKRLGAGVQVLGQASAAGDQSPTSGSSNGLRNACGSWQAVPSGKQSETASPTP